MNSRNGWTSNRQRDDAPGENLQAHRFVQDSMLDSGDALGFCDAVFPVELPSGRPQIASHPDADEQRWQAVDECVRFVACDAAVYK